MSKHPQLKKVSDNYKDFTVTKVVEIAELQCFLTEVVHNPTGATIMHIENDDPENLFCLSFQTLPDSSNGVAHILEHTVLCGSENFPVKDPFFAMTRRSLNTYMNALTGQDFTCYPASSQVVKDFYNILDVYIDAVFRPHLKYLSFLQEGHRLEFSDPKDPKSPLEYKGIVFNEMKGAMNSPMAIISELINDALLPDTTYGYNSGGDPKDIPNLTYEELIDFHKKFYHPSRCLFFFYGNLPLYKHLDFISEKILNESKKLTTPAPTINLQKRFTQPKYITSYYPVAQHEDSTSKTLIALGWLTCHILNQEELLALNIIDIILMDNDASLLKHALLKSKLCKTASAFIDTEINEAPFIIILKGCDANDAQNIEKLVKTTLKNIVETGIPLDLIENAMHQLEFFRSEITGDHSPFGLSLFMRSGLLKQHGANPEDGLMIHSLFEKIRKKILVEPKYLTNLIQKHFIDNSHFVQVVLNPSNELDAKNIALERIRLSEIRKNLSEADEKKLIDQAEELQQFQKAQEDNADIDVLPTLTLDDIPVHIRDYPLGFEKIDEFNVYHHACFTNDIIYVDLVFNLPKLEAEELAYTRLFTVLFPQIGFGGKKYTETLDLIQANTGGVSAFLSFNIQAENFDQINPTLSIRSKCLHRKSSKLFQILKDLVTSCDFSDLHRVKEIIQKHYTSLESGLNQNALRYAINYSASNLSTHSYLANAWYGLEYFKKIKDIALNFEENKHELLHHLNLLKDKILCLKDPDLVLSCDAKTYEELKSNQFYGILDIPKNAYKAWVNHFQLGKTCPSGFIIPSSVAFIGKVFSTVGYTHEDAPALNLAAFLFDNLTLHASIREQGGAYGGGAVSNAMSGNFYFYSYRDPNISNTLKAFKDAINDLLEGNFEESDVVEAKLEMIQALDSPVSPGSRADLAYGWLREGKTSKIRQDFRDRLLKLTKQDIIKAVKEQIVPNWQNGSTVVFAGLDLLEKENIVLAEKHEPTLEIKKI